MANVEKIRGRYIQRSFDGGVTWFNETINDRGFVYEVFSGLGWDGLRCTDSESASDHSLVYRLEPKPTKYEVELTDSELEDLPNWLKDKLNV